MSAERLREAAALLRERAEAATPGPWDSQQVRDDDAYYNPRVFGVRDVWVAECMPDSFTSSRGTNDAAYIAMMQPPVALAVADWLVCYAAVLTTGTPIPFDEQALAVADAVLAGVES